MRCLGKQFKEPTKNRQVLQEALGERRQHSNCRKTYKKNQPLLLFHKRRRHVRRRCLSSSASRRSWNIHNAPLLGGKRWDEKYIHAKALQAEKHDFYTSGRRVCLRQTWKPRRWRKYSKTQRRRLHSAAPCESESHIQPFISSSSGCFIRHLLNWNYVKPARNRLIPPINRSWIAFLSLCNIFSRPCWPLTGPEVQPHRLSVATCGNTRLSGTFSQKHSRIDQLEEPIISWFNDGSLM